MIPLIPASNMRLFLAISETRQEMVKPILLCKLPPRKYNSYPWVGVGIDFLLVDFYFSLKLGLAIVNKLHVYCKFILQE